MVVRFEEAKSRVGGCVWGNSKDAGFYLEGYVSLYIDVCLLQSGRGSEESIKH